MITRIIDHGCCIHYPENNDEYHVLAQVLESMNMSIVDKTPYNEIWRGSTARDIINGYLITPTHTVNFGMMEEE